MDLKSGRFYFLKDEFYNMFPNMFPNSGLIGNKDSDDEGEHRRPCFYCYENNGILWMVPISSKTEKYHKIYNEKVQKYKRNYDGIRFGYVNGKERAFLIQNICPTLPKYIEKQYCVQNGNKEVTINEELSNELNGIIRKVCRLYYQKKIKIVFTDLDTILDRLEKEK